jgi:hypothetical protein
LAQDVVRHFAGQGSIGFRLFNEVEDLYKAQIPVLKDEGLPDQIVGGVIEVLGLEGCRVNSRKAWVSLGDDVLLNQMHMCPR